MTVVVFVSASDYAIPPMIVYDQKLLHQDMYKNEIGGTLYGLSSKGWIDQELYGAWFTSCGMLPLIDLCFC